MISSIHGMWRFGFLSMTAERRMIQVVPLIVILRLLLLQAEVSMEFFVLIFHGRFLIIEPVDSRLLIVYVIIHL